MYSWIYQRSLVFIRTYFYKNLRGVFTFPCFLYIWLSGFSPHKLSVYSDHFIRVYMNVDTVLIGEEDSYLITISAIQPATLYYL